MMQQLTWDNAEDIGILLSQRHPEVAPLAVSPSDLHRYITQLPELKEDAANLNQSKLNAIQQAWHQEFQDRTQG